MICMLKEQTPTYNEFIYIYDDTGLENISGPTLLQNILKTKIDIKSGNMPLWRLLCLLKLNYAVFNYNFYNGLSSHSSTTGFLKILKECWWMMQRPPSVMMLRSLMHNDFLLPKLRHSTALQLHTQNMKTLYSLVVTNLVYLVSMWIIIW